MGFGPPQAGARRSIRWAGWAIVALAVGTAGAVALRWRPSSPSRVDSLADQDSDDDPPVPPDPGYLGPQACAPCHGRRVAEFQATPHFRACRLPESEPMPPGFAPGRRTHATHDPALRFEMTRSGNDFRMTAVHASPAGEVRTSARIDLVYGANKADEVFFSWRDDRLYELPVAWLHPQNRWGESSLNPYGSGDFSREATTRCVECHNTWFGHVAGTANQYDRRLHLVLGVTCERCHGPGREHVAFHQAHPDADTGHAVVHPGRLSRERQLEVCTQCHSNATKNRGPAFSYRLGEPLEAYFRTAVSKHPENDHVANQVKYLRQSKCFQKSDTLTCVTCHNPHRPTDAAAVGRACLKCHQPAACGERHRLPEAVRDRCVDCHMPQRVWMNVHFHTEDDQYVPPIRRHEHRIAVYPTARQEVLLAWCRTHSDPASRQEAARLTKSLVDFWLAEADRLRREYRFLAEIGAVREALRLDSAPGTRARLRQAVATQAKLDADLVDALHQADQRRFPEAIATLNRILAVKPDLALAHGKLGTLYAAAERDDLAVPHWQAVAEDDPDDAYGYTMLGWLAYLQDRQEDAVEAYRRADEIEPFNAKINYHRGLGLIKLGRLPKAAESFRRALTIDPKNAGACQGLSHVLREQGQPAEALRFARRAARLSGGQNADVLLSLADAYADAGRLADAEDTAARALDAARTSNSGLVPSVRERLEEIRGRRTEEARARWADWILTALLGVLAAASFAGGWLWLRRRSGRGQAAH
jgi:tetratricopeptide (TPR) repeat protein